MGGGSDENNVGVIGPANVQGGLRIGGKVGGGNVQNRRALSSINRNIVGAPPNLPPIGKRSLSEKHVIAETNPAVPVDRPITRKFAAELASRQQRESEGSKKPCLSVSGPSESDDRIDVEMDVPMFVQHTEAMLNEIDRMDLEMEDAAEEPVVDIDNGDKNNPLAVVEYIDELYNFYKKTETSGSVPQNYMTDQFDINGKMRSILIDWLVEVHYKFELMEETLYLTVNLIDRFLAVQTVLRKKLQLVGVTAMLLACKYEEVSVPVVEDLILISDRAYCRKEVLDMEKLMVNTLKFNLSVPTPYVFMRRFLKAAEADKKLELLSFYMIELCLVEYEMLKFPPSLLAAAAIYTAQCTLSRIVMWTKTCEFYSGYNQEQLWECARLMVTFHQKAGSGKLTGVYRKYSTSKFGYAARAEPAKFLLETTFYHC